jgi:hypothetical protein
MEWLEPEQQTSSFVDAARVWRTLDAAAAAPNLYQVASNRFEGLPEFTLDAPAFDLLLAEGFVVVPITLGNAIDSYRRLMTQSGPYRDELEQVYRRLRTARVQLRRAEKESEQRGGLFKSKTEHWNKQSRRDELEAELVQLHEKKTRLEGELEKSGALLRNLLEQIYREPQLREAGWLGDRPVVVTYNGRFLREYMAEMNAANFHGRPLAEILEIGPSLA